MSYKVAKKALRVFVECSKVAGAMFSVNTLLLSLNTFPILKVCPIKEMVYVSSGNLRGCVVLDPQFAFVIKTPQNTLPTF